MSNYSQFYSFFSTDELSRYYRHFHGNNKARDIPKFNKFKPLELGPAMQHTQCRIIFIPFLFNPKNVQLDHHLSKKCYLVEQTEDASLSTIMLTFSSLGQPLCTLHVLIYYSYSYLYKNLPQYAITFIDSWPMYLVITCTCN